MNPQQEKVLRQQLNVDVGNGPVYRERHYTITELMVMWSLSRNTIRKMVMFDPAVLKISLGTGKRCKYLVPESALERIHARCSA